MNQAIVTRTSVKRRALLLSCASTAIAAAALTPQKAPAQAFQGTPTTTTGTIGYNRATPGVETITVGSSTATIDWSPDNGGTGNIIFLPSGNTATFQGDTGLPDYTVLNRIVPTDPSRMIQFDGHVLSQLAGGATGGKVWFYSPGGIVVGATAQFDVGGLLLTSLNPTSFSASGGTFSAGASTPGKIEIDANAKINADVATGSYVALIAPRIEQGGDVRVNGSAAYIATETLTMTMSQGLFDIQIPVNVDGNGGTGDDNGIVHTGTTTGPANTAEGDNHTIYMVAVPKNQALTMLLGGTVGFDAAATDATVKNGQIILSAGWNINDTGADHDPTAAIGRNAGIDIGNTVGGDIEFTSDVYGIALGDISIGAASGDVTFAGDLDLSTFYALGPGNIRLKAEAGHTLSIGGDLDTWSYQNASPGEVSISADGGHVEVDGSVVLDAPAGDVAISALAGGTVDILGDATLVAPGSDGDGGTASISADGGEITIGGIASVNVNGYFNSAASSDSWAGTGQGGDISILASNDGSISIGGLNLAADGVGQDATGGSYGSGGTAGWGYGGSVEIGATGGGSIDITGDVDVHADGYGGNVYDGANEAGRGYGGSVEVHASSSGNIAITGKLTAKADGYGGKALENAQYFTSSGEAWSGTYTHASGGDGDGGYITINAGNSGVISTGGMDLSADGRGGDGYGYAGGGYGGTVAIDGSNGSLSVGTESAPANVNAHADGYGGKLLGEGYYHTSYHGFTTSGAPTSHFGSGTSAYAGYANGGDVRLEVNTGTIDVSGTLTMSASGTGGSVAATLTNGYGGDGDGGDATVNSYGPGSITVHGKASVLADGTGGDGQTGGDGYGGSAGVSAQDGAINFATSGDALYLAARGQGGDASLGLGGDGGDGQGGNAYIEALSYPGDVPVSGTITGANATIDISGFGGEGGAGSSEMAAGYGGDGYGGAGYNGYASDFAFESSSSAGAYIHVEGSGTLTLNNVGVIADGIGGAAQDGGQGGDGYGGIVEASYLDPYGVGAATGEMSFGALTLRASGHGGAGGTGGYGEGGQASVTVDVGELSTGDGRLELDVGATGGNGSADGGDAQGGDAYLDVSDRVTAGAFGMYANATGGSGDFGGDATDGSLTFHAYDGSLVNVARHLELGGTDNPDTPNYWGATGGAGVVQGGIGTGATVDMTIDSGATVQARYLNLYTVGYGGASAGGTGGFGQGGSTTVTISGTGKLLLFNAANSDSAAGLLAFSDAHGGASETGTGGNALGGDVTLTLDGGTISAHNFVAVTADAFGGNGATAGSATGGTSTFAITANGGALTANNFELHSWGNYTSGGGTGSDAGGDATGGTVLFDVATALNDATTATITLGSAFIDSSAIGGAGAVGGDATAGTTTVNFGAATTTITGTATIKAAAIGGNGSDGAGGDAFGNDLSVNTNGSGTLNVGTLIASADATAGNGSTQGGYAGAGTAYVEAWDTSTITAGSITASADAFGGDGQYGGNADAGTAFVSAQATGTLNVTGLAKETAIGTGGAGTSDGSGGEGYGGWAEINGVGGNTTVADALVDSSGIGGTGGVGGSGTGGESYAGARYGSLTITGTATVKSDGTGGNGTNGSGGDGNGGLAYVVANQPGDPTAALNDIHAAVLSANGTGGSGSGVEGVGGAGNGGTVTAFAASATGTLQFDSITASANGTSGAGSIAAASTGGLVEIWSQDGATVSIGAADLSALGDGGAVNVANQSCDCTLGAVSGDSLAVNSGGDFTLGDVTLTGDADLTAAGIANFLGTLSAPTITVTSGDINIASGASLGVSGITELLTLNAVANGSPVVIGSMDDIVLAAVEGGYQLNEDGDLHADALVINALPGVGDPAPDVVVHNVKIEGSQGETGHVGDVTVNTAGSILVDGLVNFINAGSGDSLTINAGLIEVNTDTGSVVMTDIDGKSGGLLSLNADNIWVGDGALLAALEEDVNFTGRDAAIATNNGAMTPEGYLRSGEVHAAVADTLFIQNSGAADDFAGVTTGDGDFVITATGDGAADVTVYGRQIKSDGTVVGGDDFAEDAITVGTFTEGSTINGCAISGCGVVTPPPVVPPPVVPPPVVPPPVVPPPVVPPPVVPPPVVPPPVVPPPVVPPPVVPPPVVPPPVVPPPVVPPPVVVPPEVPQATNSGQVLGSVGGSTSPIDMGVSQDQGSQADDQDDGDDSDDDSSGGKKTSVKAGLKMINSSPVEVDHDVDDPVTSGNDWITGD